jgi:RPA family protein
MADQQLRQTAYKVWISDLLNKPIQKEEGEWSPNYILIDNKKVSRVNIIASVVMKYVSEDKSYANLTIDDSSSDIQIKAWKEDVSIFDDINIGDPILFIGKIREYNSQVYLIPEIIRVLDKPEWIELRKKELSILYGERSTTTEEKIEQPKQEEQPTIIKEETVVKNHSENTRQKILSTIEKLDNKEGADVVQVVESLGIEESEANTVIQELLKEGEIFEIKSGKLKIIE